MDFDPLARLSDPLSLVYFCESRDGNRVHAISSMQLVNGPPVSRLFRPALCSAVGINGLIRLDFTESSVFLSAGLRYLRGKHERSLSILRV
jgi:hypothetical protein